MKEIRKTFIAFTAEEQSVLERARDICLTGNSFVEDTALNELFSDLLGSLEVLNECYSIDQFEYNECEVIGTYETEFMTDDTYSEDVEYEESENE